MLVRSLLVGASMALVCVRRFSMVRAAMVCDPDPARGTRAIAVARILRSGGGSITWAMCCGVVVLVPVGEENLVVGV